MSKPVLFLRFGPKLRKVLKNIIFLKLFFSFFMHFNYKSFKIKVVKKVVKIFLISLFCMFFFIQFPKISIANNQEKLETAADFITLGKLQKSLRILKNIKPNDTAEENEVDYLIGRIFQELNKPKKAIKYYDKVLTTNSSSSKARLGLAESYLILGELKKATFNAEIALQKNSSLIRAILILAEVDMRVGRENEANSRFEKLLGANPNSEEVTINYVTFLINQEQTDKAISYLKDFEKNNSDLADIKDLLGRILWHQGEKQEAFNYRLQAVNIYKNQTLM